MKREKGGRVEAEFGLTLSLSFTRKKMECVRCKVCQLNL
jgi:hypothetical protein